VRDAESEGGGEVPTGPPVMVSSDRSFFAATGTARK
jgi:hypothetical protein